MLLPWIRKPHLADARLLFQVVRRQMALAGLGVWGDTLLMRQFTPADKFCEFRAPAKTGFTVLLDTVYRC